MQVAVNRALHRALRSPFLYSIQTIVSSKSIQKHEQFDIFRSFGLLVIGNNTPGSTCRYDGQYLLGSGMQRLLCTTVEKPKEKPTEAVQELYQTIVKTLDSKNLPRKTLRDSLLEKCKNTEDVKLAFEILEKLRIFKMSGLCQNANWPKQITLAVASACVRGNAPDIGLRTLFRHNVYGLTPNVGAAHLLLLYSKEKKDVALMKKILGTMKKNFMKPQPKTADIVLSICNDTQQWKLMKTYAKNFLEDGVKLHRDAYDILISCAAKLGNTREVLRLQEQRLASGFKHTVPSAFACSKAYLLERQPQKAAEIIFTLNQENLSESKKKLAYEELQLLVDKWPGMVISIQDKGRRKALFTELKECISLMFNSLSNMGFEVTLNVDERYCSKNKKTTEKLLS